MPTRLTAREMSLLALDTQHTPAHTSAVDIFATPDDFDIDRLVTVISDRLAYVPRYRMRLLPVPGALAAPVWVEDEDFDLSYHVRRSALPRGGTPEQLREFVGRVCARRLDRSRPLWEVYLVEGLADNRFALVTKTHQLLVDGMDGVDLGQVLLDDTADPGDLIGGEPWEPTPEPRPVDLVVDAVRQSLTDRDALFDAARRGMTGLLGTAVAVGEAVGGVGGALGEFAGAALRGGIRPRGDTPLAGAPSEQRRVAQVSMPLEELRALRMNERYTVNDVVLALISGALRDWLATRGEPALSGGILAMVPMSVIDEDGEPTSLGSHVAPHLIQLPVDEANALMRLHQVSFGTRAHTDTGRAVSARTISDIAGFAPSTLHALGVRVAATMSRRPHDLLITNAPGPQHALYAGGAPMVASYPVLPLAPGQLLAIGVTSYNGQVFFGLTGDRDSMNDLDVLAQCLTDARLELLETAARAEATRQPTRAASAGEKKRAATKKTAPGTAVKKTATGATAKKSAAGSAAKKSTAAKTAPRKTAAKSAPRKAPIKKAAPPAAPTPPPEAGPGERGDT
ncbi:wax ester/triacylglycerol synthase family O-acyltransferase [Granulicoccus sp. GXG6511]|uniref:wax ester/triacylglycerol synthase family O-acyltransferase n=1 Tax=Granulicoccus sp. GXG6511 TaxID=3381351 RepID=UPI003D7E8328